MTARVRGSLSRSHVLFYLSAVTLLLCSKPAAASVPPAGTTIITEANPEVKLPPFLKQLLFNVGAPSDYFPVEKLSPATTTYTTHLVIKLHNRQVYVYRGDRLQASYPIAVGKAGWETPTGHFQVIQMQRDPAWEHPWTGKIIPPGPDNPLGARWIGFWTDGQNFIGFHGTPNEKVVGQAVSHGCIRMRNKDVLALYGQVEIGTPVTVEP